MSPVGGSFPFEDRRFPNNLSGKKTLKLSSMRFAHCAGSENIHIHTRDGQWKFRGGGGSL